MFDDGDRRQNVVVTITNDVQGKTIAFGDTEEGEAVFFSPTVYEFLGKLAGLGDGESAENRSYVVTLVPQRGETTKWRAIYVNSHLGKRDEPKARMRITIEQLLVAIGLKVPKPEMTTFVGEVRHDETVLDENMASEAARRLVAAEQARMHAIKTALIEALRDESIQAAVTARALELLNDEPMGSIGDDVADTGTGGS